MHLHEVFLKFSYYYKYQDKMHVRKNKTQLRKNSNISPFQFYAKSNFDNILQSYFHEMIKKASEIFDRELKVCS